MTSSSNSVQHRPVPIPACTRRNRRRTRVRIGEWPTDSHPRPGPPCWPPLDRPSHRRARHASSRHRPRPRSRSCRTHSRPRSSFRIHRDPGVDHVRRPSHGSRLSEAMASVARSTVIPVWITRATAVTWESAFRSDGERCPGRNGRPMILRRENEPEPRRGKTHGRSREAAGSTAA